METDMQSKAIEGVLLSCTRAYLYSMLLVFLILSLSIFLLLCWSSLPRFLPLPPSLVRLMLIQSTWITSPLLSTIHVIERRDTERHRVRRKKSTSCTHNMKGQPDRATRTIKEWVEGESNFSSLSSSCPLEHFLLPFPPLSRVRDQYWAEQLLRMFHRSIWPKLSRAKQPSESRNRAKCTICEHALCTRVCSARWDGRGLCSWNPDDDEDDERK